MSATGSSSEPSGEERPLRRAMRPSNQSVAMATHEHRGRPVVVVRERDREQRDDDRHGDGASRSSADRRSSYPGEYGDVRQGPRREQGRDRRSDLPLAPRPGDRVGRGLLRRRSRRRSIPATPTRPTRSAARPRRRAIWSSRSCWRRRKRPALGAIHPGLRVPRRERRVRAGGRGGGSRLDRAAARGDRADGVEDAGPAGDAGGGRPDHPGHDRPGRLRRGGRRARRASSGIRS